MFKHGKFEGVYLLFSDNDIIKHEVFPKLYTVNCALYTQKASPIL